MKSKTTIPVPALSQLDAQDNERIYAGDLWCNIQAIGFYSNLLETLREDVDDRDWWRFPPQVLRHSEIAALYDSLLKQSKRARLAAMERFRKQPPELEDGDSCDDIYPRLSLQEPPLPAQAD